MFSGTNPAPPGAALGALEPRKASRGEQKTGEGKKIEGESLGRGWGAGMRGGLGEFWRNPAVPTGRPAGF